MLYSLLMCAYLGMRMRECGCRQLRMKFPYFVVVTLAPTSQPLSSRSVLCAAYYQRTLHILNFRWGDVNLCSAWIFSPFFISSDTDNAQEMVKWESAPHPQITEARKWELAIITIINVFAHIMPLRGGGGCCLLSAIKWMWSDLCYVWRLFSDHHPFF